MSDPATGSSIPFDPYTAATSFDASQLQTYPDFSPEAFFDTEDFDIDLATDSATSPLSPRSPALSASSFNFPTTDAWTAWDSVQFSPEPEKLFVCQTLGSCSPPKASSNPVINPLDLTVAPFFQSPQVLLATVPSRQQPTTAAPATFPSQSMVSPSASTPAPKRYPTRGLKRKSTSDPSDSERARKSAAISPAPTASTKGRSSTISATPKSKSKPATPTTPTTPVTPATSGPRKTAHNMIEKRYRTNLNDKIAQLRDAVPALRLLAEQKSAIADGTDGDGDEAEETGPGSGHVGSGGGRLNKATILSKAVEYIMQLEQKNMGLQAENGELRGHVEGMQLMMMGGAGFVGGVGGSSGGGVGVGVMGDGGGVQVLGGWN